MGLILFSGYRDTLTAVVTYRDLVPGALGKWLISLTLRLHRDTRLSFETETVATLYSIPNSLQLRVREK